MTEVAEKTLENSGTSVAPQKLSIVVADRGHVWVGEVHETQGDFFRVDGARAVRRWGTSEGLNELAVKGPLRNTKLDAAATVRVAKRAVIAIIPCEPTAWTA